MKKLILFCALFFAFGALFATKSNVFAGDFSSQPILAEKFSNNVAGEINGSMNKVIQQANELGDGRGSFGFTYDPAGSNNLLLSANFSIIGHWGMEIGAGWSYEKGGFAVEADILNFQWTLPFCNRGFFSITAGFGCPIVLTITENKNDPNSSDEENKEEVNDVLGIKPSFILGLHLFADRDFGLSVFVKPGFVIATSSENCKFSMPMGISVRMPGSIIAEAFESLM